MGTISTIGCARKPKSGRSRRGGKFQPARQPVRENRDKKRTDRFTAGPQRCPRAVTPGVNQDAFDGGVADGSAKMPVHDGLQTRMTGAWPSTRRSFGPRRRFSCDAVECRFVEKGRCRWRHLIASRRARTEAYSALYYLLSMLFFSEERREPYQFRPSGSLIKRRGFVTCLTFEASNIFSAVERCCPRITGLSL